VFTLSKAILLGPYEMKTQEIIIPLIFKHWSLLINNKIKKSKIINILKHALKYRTHVDLTFDKAKKYQRLVELAPLLTKKWHKRKLKKYLRETTNE
jgi:hypothetical protein